MAKVLRTQLFPSVNELTDEKTKSFMVKLISFLDDTFRKVAEISFNNSEKLTKTTANADTEFSITHHLGRKPTGYIVTKSDKACSVYDSGTTWTTDTIYLKCNVATVAMEIYVF